MATSKLPLSNWDEILCVAINKEGFASVSEFLEHFPTSSYESLIEKLGFNPVEDTICLEILQRNESIRQKRRKYAVMDALVRYINRDQVSWDRKMKSINKRVGKTYYEWYSFVHLCVKDVVPEVKRAKAKQVWDTLEELTAGHHDWCPASVDDPYIVKAFEHIDW